MTLYILATTATGAEFAVADGLAALGMARAIWAVRLNCCCAHICQVIALTTGRLKSNEIAVRCAP